MLAAGASQLAELAVVLGANVQQEQLVTVGASLGEEEMAQEVAAAAYRHGARFVDVTYFDPYVKRARIEHARGETLGFVPSWYGDLDARARAAAGGEGLVLRPCTRTFSTGLTQSVRPTSRRSSRKC